jgi:flagellar biosynthetic protein FlhB
MAAVGLGVGSVALLLGASHMGRGLGEVFIVSYAHAADPTLDLGTAMSLSGWIALSVASILAAPLGAIWMGTAIVGGIQSRGVVPDEPLKLDWNKIDPIAGFKRQFLSSKPLVELVKGVSKLGILAWLVWTGLESHLGMLPTLIADQPHAVLNAYREMALLILTRALPLAVAVAVIDYSHQWYQLNEKMKMTREEVKDEQKQADGDPHVKTRRRQRMRQLATAQSVSGVQTADVVITNPTHYAVALVYDPANSAAPVVVARGVDHLALRIRNEAASHDVPQVENRPLARALYAQTKAGDEIPEELFATVAQILAVIWKGRKRRGRSAP